MYFLAKLSAFSDTQPNDRIHLGGEILGLLIDRLNRLDQLGPATNVLSSLETLHINDYSASALARIILEKTQTLAIEHNPNDRQVFIETLCDVFTAERITGLDKAFRHDILAEVARGLPLHGGDLADLLAVGFHVFLLENAERLTAARKKQIDELFWALCATPQEKLLAEEKQASREKQDWSLALIKKTGAALSPEFFGDSAAREAAFFQSALFTDCLTNLHRHFARRDPALTADDFAELSQHHRPVDDLSTDQLPIKYRPQPNRLNRALEKGKAPAYGDDVAQQLLLSYRLLLLDIAWWLTEEPKPKKLITTTSLLSLMLATVVPDKNTVTMIIQDLRLVLKNENSFLRELR